MLAGLSCSGGLGLLLHEALRCCLRVVPLHHPKILDACLCHFAHALNALHCTVYGSILHGVVKGKRSCLRISWCAGSEYGSDTAKPSLGAACSRRMLPRRHALSELQCAVAIAHHCEGCRALEDMPAALA